MSEELEELYQTVILDHSKRPRNRGEIPGATQVHGDNPSCGDEIMLSVKFGTAGEVEDIKFTGSGCAISQASASLMTMKLKGKPREEATRLLREDPELSAADHAAIGVFEARREDVAALVAVELVGLPAGRLEDIVKAQTSALRDGGCGCEE